MRTDDVQDINGGWIRVPGGTYTGPKKRYDMAKKKLTKSEATETMKKIASYSKHDAEEAHSDADDLLCKVLEELGYKALVKHYNDVKKWYS